MLNVCFVWDCIDKYQIMEDLICLIWLVLKIKKIKKTKNCPSLMLGIKNKLYKVIVNKILF